MLYYVLKPGMHLTSLGRGMPGQRRGGFNSTIHFPGARAVPIGCPWHHRLGFHKIFVWVHRILDDECIILDGACRILNGVRRILECVRRILDRVHRI